MTHIISTQRLNVCKFYKVRTRFGLDAALKAKYLKQSINDVQTRAKCRRAQAVTSSNCQATLTNLDPPALLKTNI